MQRGSLHARQRDALAKSLHLCHSLQELELSVHCNTGWQLDTTLSDPKLIEKLAELPEKALRVNAGPSALPNESSVPSSMQRCKELHAVVKFTCLTVANPGGCAGAAVREACEVWAGNLRKLVCTADAWLPSHVDWCSHLPHVQELHLLPRFPCDGDVQALQAAVKLPRLRKLVVFASSEEAWCAVCNLTQLEELRITCAPGEHIGELGKLRRLSRLRMWVYLPCPMALRAFADGLVHSMPHVKDLQICSPEFAIRRGVDPSL